MVEDHPHGQGVVEVDPEGHLLVAIERRDGDRLEVLERALMSVRVRTETGEEGWVKTAYLVEEEPARRRATGLESATARLAAELETMPLVAPVQGDLLGRARDDVLDDI